MATYYLYHLQPNGRIDGRTDIEAQDDAQAIGLAEQACDSDPMELWLGARMVKKFPARPKTEQPR